MNENKIVLKFCVLCGQKVQPYHYSICGYEEFVDYESKINSPFFNNNNPDGLSAYYCYCTGKKNIAPNTMNTGTNCPDCGNFANIFASYCGVCSKKLNFFSNE